MRKLLWLFCFALFSGAPASAQDGDTSRDILTYNINSGGSGSKWDFSYAQLTDLHIGYNTTDYGTPGYDDLPPDGDEGTPAKNLRAAVNRINSSKDSLKIKFVAVTGDLTQHAQKSEYLKAREILDSLDVPYVPVIGNHDVWPYSVGGAVAPAPAGDEYFKDIFAPVFSRLRGVMPGWDDGTRLSRTTDPVTNTASYFQNYAFRYGGYAFAALDFIGRTYKPDGGPKTGYKIDFFDFPGGTWHWFKNHYANSEAGPKHLIVLSHFPLTRETWQGYFLFSPQEYAFVADYLGRTPHIGLWNCGHVHRNTDYPVITSDGTTLCPVVETASNREKITIRLVKVWD
ncbi:MAG: metallophosphoesterase [Elusimicrobiaceae bacterium]|nr:metallophosphoesterase [Elusimicrobiaceae bacterium]